MNSMTRLITMLVVALLVTLLAAAPAGAQGYTGYIEHPYPSAGLWYCDYYGSDYYCQDERGNWFPAAPSWYDASYAEMMSIFGQGVL